MTMRLFFLVWMIFPTLLMAEDLPVIQSVDIAPVNPDTYGIGKESDSPIPLDLWEGLSHAQVVRLMKSLPEQQNDPTLAHLQNALLTTATKVAEKESTEEESLLKLRVERLLALWKIEKAHALAKRYPDVLQKDAWAWLQFSYYMSIENYSEALVIAKAAIAENPENAKWSKAMVTLQLLKGQKEAALFGLSLLEETPNTDNAFFLNLAKKTAQNKPLDEGFEPSDILEFKLWMKENQKKFLEIPAQFLPLALMDKTYASLALKEKLLVAERAFREGSLCQEKLQALYKEHGKKETPTPTKEENDQAIKLPPVPLDWEKNDPMTRAELYVKLTTTNAEEKQEHIINAARHLMKHRHHALVPLFVEHFQALPMDASLTEHAATFATILLRHGATEYAMEWLSLLTLEQKTALAPLILMRVDDLSLESRQNLLTLWYDTHGKDLKQAPLMLGMFEALIPGISQYNAFMTSTSEESMALRAPAHLWQSLFALDQQKGVGLIMLLRLAKDILVEDHAPLLPYIIRSLKSLGFTTEAKAIALRYMLKAHD